MNKTLPAQKQKAVPIGALVLLSAFRQLSEEDQDLLMMVVVCQSSWRRRWLAGQISWEGRAVIRAAVDQLGRSYVMKQ